MESKQVSIFDHLQSILALPFMVVIVIPSLIYFFNEKQCCDIFISFPEDTVSFFGGFFCAIGLLLFISTVWLFHKRGNGTLAPWNPPKKLVVEGPFQYVRNPMLVGVNLLLFSIAFTLENENILLWSVFFIALNTIYFIKKEEPDLVKRFGEDYVEYCKNVRRWIPRLTPWNVNS